MASIWVAIVILSAVSLSSGTIWSQDYAFESKGDISGTEVVRILNKGTRKCVDNSGASLDNGSRIQMWDCNDSAAQLWKILPSHPYYQLQNVGSGKCIDIDRQSTSDGGKLHQWTCGSQLSQQWRQESDGHIVGRHSGKCFDIVGQNAASGTGLHLWSCL